VYTRWSNPTTRQLEQKLAVLEEAEACVAFASGMAASSAVLLNYLSSGDHLIISNTNYPGTAEFARDTLTRFGVEVSAVDTADLDRIQQAVRDNTRMIWIETPSNPLLRISDIKAISALAVQQQALLVVDSTFATPIATQPLTLGADLVVHSLTKYVGGHGDAMGGSVCGSQSLIGPLRGEALVHYGGVISPFNAWLILRGMATLPIRMRSHEENALTVAKFLEDHPSVEKVFYPGLPSHPQHILAKQQMANFSGMISFRSTNPKQVAERMMEQLEVIHYAVSLGHHRSLVYLMQTSDLVGSSYRLEGEELDKYRDSAGDGIFRLSVGLENAGDLCEDLARVL
ncbi:MAG: aminotransferase class I/II-fold pyridoxal phosphate-dependent enzyme, partial [Gammaproteobacteria bacterium]|nr:aminotransferase class I/II-fold pyridoxal phosphate-dependent enzyme [Gammaproteobacteria bacterium]